VADTHNLAGLDGTQSVSTLGLRWAALRGMLSSPLIMADDQRSLRDELLRELGTLERDFSSLPSRNTTEISAKIDIAKSALQESARTGQSWLVDLLESVQADLHNVNAKTPSATPGRPAVNLTRTHPQRADEHASSAANEEPASSAA
jgi:hypothetical protein